LAEFLRETGLVSLQGRVGELEAIPTRIHAYAGGVQATELDYIFVSECLLSSFQEVRVVAEGAEGRDHLIVQAGTQREVLFGEEGGAATDADGSSGIAGPTAKRMRPDYRAVQRLEVWEEVVRTTEEAFSGWKEKTKVGEMGKWWYRMYEAVVEEAVPTVPVGKNGVGLRGQEFAWFRQLGTTDEGKDEAERLLNKLSRGARGDEREQILREFTKVRKKRKNDTRRIRNRALEQVCVEVEQCPEKGKQMRLLKAACGKRKAGAKRIVALRDKEGTVQTGAEAMAEVGAVWFEHIGAKKAQSEMSAGECELEVEYDSDWKQWMQDEGIWCESSWKWLNRKYTAMSYDQLTGALPRPKMAITTPRRHTRRFRCSG
jgi:hypothetical protein